MDDLVGARSPGLVLERGRGGLAPIVTREMEALVFNLNRELQDAFIADNLKYVDLIVKGGQGNFLGRDFDVLGLRRTDQLLSAGPARPAHRRGVVMKSMYMISRDRPQAAHRRAARRADHRRLRDRGVDDAPGTELLQQAARRARRRRRRCRCPRPAG